jgi:hypothetical protein
MFGSNGHSATPRWDSLTGDSKGDNERAEQFGLAGVMTL